MTQQSRGGGNEMRVLGQRSQRILGHKLAPDVFHQKADSLSGNFYKNNQAIVWAGDPWKNKVNEDRDFPGGPVSKTPHSQWRGPPGWIPGQGTRSHMRQLRVCMPHLEDPTCQNEGLVQPNKY